jgi:fructose-1,6-bisphosphatase/inositol monophosphatase family enzyme
MNDLQLRGYIDFAKKVALKAGVIMNKYFYADQRIEIKSDSSPVTIADKEINSLLIDLVKKHYPDHGVRGEEESWCPEEKILWVCDPIDGTKAFTVHMPLAMFSLALVEDGRPILAAAYNPFTDTLYEAQLGQGARRNGETIHVSDRSWGAGLQLVGSGHGIYSHEPVDSPLFLEELQRQKITVSNVPSTVFKGCLIAEGSLDGRTFMHSGAHDIAAIKLIIEEAGGKVTDLAGDEQRYDQPINGAIMSNGLIHDELLDLVGRHANLRD